MAVDAAVEVDEHAICFGHGSDMVCGGDRASDRSLLLVICETLSGEVSSTALGHLQDDRRLDIPEESGDKYSNCGVKSGMGLTYRAASRHAFTVDDDVQFYKADQEKTT